MKVAAVFLLVVSAAYALPLENRVKAEAHTVNAPDHSAASASASSRFARASTAHASSETGPSGSKSSAGASSTPDFVAPGAGAPGSFPPPPPSSGGAPPSGPVVEPVNPPPSGGFVPSGPPSGPVEPVGPSSGSGGAGGQGGSGPGDVPFRTSGPGAGPAPVDHGVPHGHKGAVSIQKVKAAANMETGTAIATATKRAADIQKVEASGNKAIASATNKKAGPGTQLQDVSATGNQLAVAKADSSPVERFARDTAVQKVAASGNKAIAKATNNKVADKTIQSVTATGGELAIATADNGSGGSGAPVVPEVPAGGVAPAPVPEVPSGGAPAPGAPGAPGAPEAPAPAPGPAQGCDEGGKGSKRFRREDKTFQRLVSSGKVAISTVSAKTEGDVSSSQTVQTTGSDLSIANAIKS